MSGPRFIPFADMTYAERAEHLRRVHGSWVTEHHAAQELVRCHGQTSGTPHTHDKPAPRPEENR